MLRPIQTMFQPGDYPDLLVGLSTPDDAAVYRLDDTRALVFTTDFFTPIVDDPYQYGLIAAANAISDIYAMGAQPLFALNIAALPPDLPIEMMETIMRGMATKVAEANAVIAGGHTIQDKEPKIGLAVVGLVDPARMLAKTNAIAGDVLVLTKPLGTGCITTAAKNDVVQSAHLENAVQWMTQLNRAAAEAAMQAHAHAATDITGFGLIGHASEVALASHVTLAIEYHRLPWLEGAQIYADEWIFPGGSADNKRIYESDVFWATPLPEENQMLLFDAQTSGGLLIALPANMLDTFGAIMNEKQASWWEVGRVIPYQEKLIHILP